MKRPSASSASASGRADGSFDIRNELRLRPTEDGTVDLAGYPTDTTAGIGDRKTAERAFADIGVQLGDLHERLLANGDRSFLVVLQGLDASGKNGIAKHVGRFFDPSGLHVTTFGPPTAEEGRHGFLWRIRKQVPAPGTITIFNRSHYEDAIVPVAVGASTPSEVARRIRQIRDFEQELLDAGTVIVKCVPHISYDEQRERFLRRLTRADKQWKFSEADLDTRKRWSEFQASYAMVLGQTDRDEAPWYIVPADRRWYRNWAIARLLADTLADVARPYPHTALDVDRLRANLEAPN